MWGQTNFRELVPNFHNGGAALGVSLRELLSDEREKLFLCRFEMLDFNRN